MNNKKQVKKTFGSGDAWDMWDKAYKEAQELEMFLNKHKKIAPEEFLYNCELLSKNELRKPRLSDLLDIGLSVDFIKFCFKNNLMMFNEEDTVFIVKSYPLDDIYLKLMVRVLRLIDVAQSSEMMTPMEFLENYKLYLSDYKSLINRNITVTDLLDIGLSQKFIDFCFENDLMCYWKDTIFVCKSKPSFKNGLSLDLIAKVLGMFKF